MENKLDRNNVENFMALTSLQQGMLFHYISDEKSTEYIEQLSLTITGDIKVDLLQIAWNFVVGNNEMLRTVFRWRGIDKPVQIVLKKHKVLIRNIDFTNELVKNEAVENIKLKDLNNIIDITKETLRVYLCKLDNYKYEMIISNHHILYDGWSNGIIIKELMETYNCLYKGNELKRVNKTKFSEFIKYVNTLNKDDEKKYWVDYLQNLESKDDCFYSKEKSVSKEISHKMDEVKVNRIKCFAKENKILLSSILYVAWGLLVQKLSNTDDVLFGTTVSGRSENIKGIDNMVGLFINTIPLRVKSEKNTTFMSLIYDVDTVLNERRDFENTSLVDLKEYCGLKLNEDIFNSIVTIQNYPLNLEKENILSIENFSIIEKTNYNMSLEILTFVGLEFKFNFNSASIEENIVKKLGVYLERIIDTLLNNKNIKISEVILLSIEETNQILYEFNNTKTDYPKNKTIQELFEDQVERCPNNIAIVFEDKKLTYIELNEKANQLARILRNEGVKADSIVGIMVERSPEMIIGIMAILKAGGAYLPIDPSYPPIKIQYMLEDSGSNILLSTESLLHKIEFNGQIIDLFKKDLYEGDLSNLEQINNCSSLAYVIYTSGSTGKPKGVMIEHVNINNFIHLLNKQFDREFDHSERILSLTNYVFDVSVCEFFISLNSGSVLVINNKHKTFDPIEIAKLIVDNGITFIYISPSLLSYVYEELKKCKNKVHLRKLLVGVEPIRGVTLSKFYDLNKDLEILNGYGPTETTISSTYYKVTGNESQNKAVPIGKPVENTSIYILDKSYKIVPVGVVGEIFISGDGVSRGYINKPELTTEKFVENPFELGTKMYKTGDLAKWMPDGNIEFSGRKDNQVKIRGFRIELGEIENSLLQHEDIKETIVVVKENKENEKYICAFVVSEREISDLNLKGYLKESLPEYMVPAYFVQLEKMPLTSNGKLDKKALPEPNVDSNLNEYEAPRNEIEEKLLIIWSEILGVEKSGINDNFFDLGGHSLKAMLLIAKIHKELNREIPLKELFRSPTIKALSRYIENAEENLYSNIKKLEENEYYETSSAQKRMYMLQQFNIDSVAYNIPVVFELEGEIIKEKIEETLKKLSVRHEALRTYFEIIEGKIVQKIDNSYEFKLVDRKDNEKVQILINKFVRPFELEKTPLFRVELLENRDKNYLFIDMHHIISDGVSMSILIKEFTALYNGETLEHIKLQYKDFAAWQNHFLKSEEMKKQEEYWVNQFRNEIPVLNLKYDYERTVMQNLEGDSISVEVNEKVTEGLRKLAKRTGTTMHMILLSVFNILLSRYSGQEDIVVGTPIAGRTHVGLQNIMGMFVNTLPLRNKPEGDKNYLEFLKEVKENCLKAYENQSYQLETLVEKLDIRSDTSRNHIFDVIFNMIDIVDRNVIELDGVLFKKHNKVNKMCKVDLSLDVLEKDKSLELEFEYCTKLFKKETITRMSKQYTKVIEDILKDTEIKISLIDILTEEERKQIIYEFNNTKTDYPMDKTILDLFEEQVERTPNNIAVEYDEQYLTYSELNIRANQLALKLINEGVCINQIVCIIAENSLEIIVGILGIFKSGGVYLPIDPSYPVERINYMLQDSGSSILLTQSYLNYEMNFKGKIIYLDKSEFYIKQDDNVKKMSNSSDLAYVIYTSGSTGQSKGVIVDHKSLINLCWWYKNQYDISESTKNMILVSIAFDASIKNIITPLISGGSIILRELKYYDANNILNTIEFKKITMINCVPSAIYPIIELAEKDHYIKLASMKYLLLGGEELSLFKMEKWIGWKNNRCILCNIYGPTECTDISVAYTVIKRQVKEFKSIPIGVPINNLKAYIVNGRGNIQPIGIPGELCISGDGLARGYLNRPELTAEKFTDNPFEYGQRMYKTGDLAMWLPNGNIVFLGRMDNQVKIRGFRIELGEIEGRLLQHEDIKEVAVVAKIDKDNEKYICAYVVCNKEINYLNLKSYLKERLPKYMIPSFFIQLEKFPLTPNGKIDRKVLPVPNKNLALNEYEAPRNEVECKLAKIWSEILDIEKVGINDNFFDLGGHSLKATVLISRIHKELNREVQLKALFKSPTIMELSKLIEVTEENLYSKVAKVGDKRHYESSSAQKRMYMLQQFNKDSIAYNMPVVFELIGEIHKDTIRESFENLALRHEALRTYFEVFEGRIIQKINNFYKFKLIHTKYNEEIETIINKFVRPFELEKAPLFRVEFVENRGKTYLFIDMHHIISDGVSISILIKEFSVLYNGETLEYLKLQYKDFAAWQNNFLKSKKMKEQEEYWIHKFSGEMQVLNLPYDYERPVMQSFKGDSVSVEVDKKTTEGLRKLAKETEATIHMVLLSAFYILLSKYSGHDDIVVGTPVAGRSHLDFQNIVGMFVNTLALRNKLEGNKKYVEFLKAVKENCLKAYENQSYQLETLVEKLDIKRDTSRNPLFDVMFNMVDTVDGNDIQLNRLLLKTYDMKSKTSKVDLSLTLIEERRILNLKLVYCIELFHKDTIEIMINDYLNILKTISIDKEVELDNINLKHTQDHFGDNSHSTILGEEFNL